ncbi:MAG: porin family protein [Pseudomonadota bacterium]|jgi:opacity protein-like surface antigen|nr:porin family protein [Pseudomonadota bacterium]
MFRVLSACVLAWAGLAAAGHAQTADNGFNLSAGYSRIDLENFDLGAATIRGGYDFNRYLGVEAQLDIGIDGDDANACPVDAVCIAAISTLDLEYSVGAFAVGRVPLTDSFSVFGRLGYVTTEFDANFAYGGSTDDQAIAWGVGAQYEVWENGAIRFDYTRTDYDDFGEADSFGLSYVHRFGG